MWGSIQYQDSLSRFRHTDRWKSSWHQLCHHCGTLGCHNDNLGCHQWLQSLCHQCHHWCTVEFFFFLIILLLCWNVIMINCGATSDDKFSIMITLDFQCIPIVKIRGSQDHLIFIMGIPILMASLYCNGLIINPHSYHNRHPIAHMQGWAMAHVLGRAMGCLLWV